jgi:hypothetical protein
VGCFPQSTSSPPTSSPSYVTALPIPTITPTAKTPFTPGVTPFESQEPVKAIRLLFYLPVEGPFSIANEVSAIINSEPVLLSRLVGPSGESLGTSFIPWEIYTMEMESCIAWDQPCPVSGRWVRLEERLVLRRNVEWVGARQLWVTVRYRDSSGKSIPIEYGGKDLVDIAQVPQAVEGAWDPATPVEALPAPVQTALAQTQVAYPLTGSVTWEDGRCCAGGTAGETIQVRADFSSSSPHGDVVEMRVRTGSTCFTEEEMEQAAWEPFVPQRSFPFTLAINWVGFYITAQYRDLNGNLSPAFCDDISLEGMPPRTP